MDADDDATPPGYRLERRPATDAEARLLHEELKTTENILGYTVRELRRARDLWLAHDATTGALAGMCLSFDLPLGWTEIAALYVLPAHRRRGVGAALLTRAWERAAGRGRHVYMLSRNPTVVAWMETRGMLVSSALWRAPLAVHLFMPLYMASLHRHREAWRKRHLLAAAPPLVQGVRRHPGRSADPTND
jgi:GNAT superfamily N-acetyltransferase